MFSHSNSSFTVNPSRSLCSGTLGKDPVWLAGVPDGVEVMVGIAGEETDDGLVKSSLVPDPAVGPAFEAAVVVVGC